MVLADEEDTSKNTSPRQCLRLTISGTLSLGPNVRTNTWVAPTRVNPYQKHARVKKKR